MLRAERRLDVVDREEDARVVRFLVAEGNDHHLHATLEIASELAERTLTLRRRNVR